MDILLLQDVDEYTYTCRCQSQHFQLLGLTAKLSPSHGVHTYLLEDMMAMNHTPIESLDPIMSMLGGMYVDASTIATCMLHGHESQCLFCTAFIVSDYLTTSW